MTDLVWSESIGKRVRTGDWSEQTIPTLTKAREALVEAGDDFGLKAGRRETAAQLVDYFMEEVKVVYVIYEVWTKGFLDWLLAQGVPQEELDTELVRLKALMAYPDGTPLDTVARWEELGARAGRVGNKVRAYQISVAEANVELDGINEDWRRLHDRYADVMAGVLAFVAKRFGRGIAGGLLSHGSGAVHPGALYAVRRTRQLVRVDARAQHLHDLRGYAIASRGTGTGWLDGDRRGRRPHHGQFRSLWLGWPLDARRPHRRHRLTCPGAI